MLAGLLLPLGVQVLGGLFPPRQFTRLPTQALLQLLLLGLEYVHVVPPVPKSGQLHQHGPVGRRRRTIESLGHLAYLLYACAPIYICLLYQSHHPPHNLPPACPNSFFILYSTFAGSCAQSGTPMSNPSASSLILWESASLMTTFSSGICTVNTLSGTGPTSTRPVLFD